MPVPAGVLATTDQSILLQRHPKTISFCSRHLRTYHRLREKCVPQTSEFYGAVHEIRRLNTMLKEATIARARQASTATDDSYKCKNRTFDSPVSRILFAVMLFLPSLMSCTADSSSQKELPSISTTAHYAATSKNVSGELFKISSATSLKAKTTHPTSFTVTHLNQQNKKSGSLASFDLATTVHTLSHKATGDSSRASPLMTISSLVPLSQSSVSYEALMAKHIFKYGESTESGAWQPYPTSSQNMTVDNISNNKDLDTGKQSIAPSGTFYYSVNSSQIHGQNVPFYLGNVTIEREPTLYVISNVTDISLFERAADKQLGIYIAKTSVMILIILVAVLGNSLVIISVTIHRRLHCPANYILVSLATADLLVALCAMTFNLSVQLTGGFWLFGDVMCDLWNSFDVYFSTVSILHLCSISVDRYYAIVRPLEYPLKMTNKMLAFLLIQAWLAPVLISFLPIFFGWYTTHAHLQERLLNPYKCGFKVNAVYAIMSSSVSFWLPCSVMVVMYFRIFQEARKQERALLTRASSTASAAAARLNGTLADPKVQLLAALQGVPLAATPRHQEFIMKSLKESSPSNSPSRTGKSAGDGGGGGGGGRRGLRSSWRRQESDVGGSGSETPQILWPEMVTGSTRRSANAANAAASAIGRREHKAARTLGLIMGAFVMCWLPFFTWYVSTNICDEHCANPEEVITIVFWIGYFNSTLNPFIYAYMRADFRHAFRRTLTRCCRPTFSTGEFV